ncbi:MAG: molybdenum cofactor biosynthesis protein MoaE [Candidatus Odinarchaeia archaeon]
MYEGKIVNKNEVTFNELLEKIKKSKDLSEAGAIVSFIGIVRSTTKNGKKVKGLFIEAWEEKANNTLMKIAKELSNKKGITDVIIYHLVGELNVGDDIVYVLIAGDHRENVFPVLKEAVERYKNEVEVWKKEILETGESYWTKKIK